MRDLHMPQSIRLALQYSTTPLPPALDSVDARLILILVAERINVLIFGKPKKHAQMKSVLPIRKFFLEIDRKRRMQKRKKKDHKSPRRRITDPEANYTPSRKSNSHAMILCLRLAYPRPFTIGTSTYARFVEARGPHTKGSSPSPSPSPSSPFISLRDGVSVLGGAVRCSDRGGRSGLLGRKSGSGSDGGSSTGVESSSPDLAFPFPLSGLAVFEGVTRAQIPNQYTQLYLAFERTVTIPRLITSFFFFGVCSALPCFRRSQTAYISRNLSSSSSPSSCFIVGSTEALALLGKGATVC